MSILSTPNLLPRPIQRFLVAHGAAAFALGIHQVLLAWLSIAVLHLESHQLGWVQAAGLLPNLVLMLISGAIADRRNAYAIMIFAQAGLTLSYVVLALLVNSENLNLYSLILYAVAVGSANAFLQPAREKVVGELSQHSMQVKISRASIVQFSLQATGVVVAALSDQTGLVMVIGVQAFVSALGALQLVALARDNGWQTAAVTDQTIVRATPLAQQILDGIKIAFADKRIAQLIGLVSFNGFMHMGLYIVAMPLLARDGYGLNALEYGLLQFCFVVGMLSAYVIILLKPHIEYPAQGALFSLLYSAIVGYALSQQPTVTGLYILVVFWGWIAGYSATHCRMIMQILARSEVKGRLLSLYQLMLFGMAPLGALTTGYLSVHYTLASLFSVLSGASVFLFVLFLFTRALWSVKQESSEVP